MVRLRGNEYCSLVRFFLIFQFLYGAIERSNSVTSSCSCYISIPIWCDWESQSVAKKRKSSSFQFLYGAIESYFATKRVEAFFHFNSYMVRLRDLIGLLVGQMVKHFNSYMVRLRALWQSLDLQVQGNFNSYMVRLRDRSTRRYRFNYKISIPIWCDWELCERV